MRCHNCNSYCCSTRPVPSHDTHLRDRCGVAMIRACNTLWAGDYYPVVHHRGDLMDPYCGAPRSSSSWDLSDPTTGTAWSPPRNTSHYSTQAALLYWVPHELTTTITCTFHVIVVDSTRARARLPSERSQRSFRAPRTLPPTRPVPPLGQRSTPFGRFHGSCALSAITATTSRNFRPLLMFSSPISHPDAFSNNFLS